MHHKMLPREDFLWARGPKLDQEFGYRVRDRHEKGCPVDDLWNDSVSQKIRGCAGMKLEHLQTVEEVKDTATCLPYSSTAILRVICEH